jgi:phosphoesterase RecJ-like protein
MTDELHTSIKDLIQNAQRVALVAHIRPDGDAIGAMLGLGMALQSADKEVQMILSDGVPRSFRHLPSAKQIQKRLEGTVDLAIVLDCSDLLRTGGVLGDRLADINIDHHITNLEFARVNFVAPQYPATSAILAEFLPRWGLTITLPIAQALLSGIISDTIGFRTSNTTSHTLRLAADLMDLGCDMPDLYNRMLIRRSFTSARYWGIALERLQRENNLIWTSLTLEDRANAGYSGNDDADLTNLLSAIEEGEVAVLFIEQKKGRVKVSWRSVPDVDISQLALSFGGGGHPNAAGVELEGSMETIQNRVLETTRQLLNSKKPHIHDKINSEKINLSSSKNGISNTGDNKND